jgi:hypothetical protein
MPVHGNTVGVKNLCFKNIYLLQFLKIPAFFFLAEMRIKGWI